MHFMRIDFRIGALKQMMSSFKVILDRVIDDLGEDDNGFWDMIYADDMEHVVGMAFIALQNYINGSISDLYPELENIHVHYSSDEKIDGSNTTRINLIVVLANYYKHRDHPKPLHKNTVNPLIELGIDYVTNLQEIKEAKNLNKNVKEDCITGASSPVFEGLNVLSKNWDLNDLVNIVAEWRENMWLKEEN